MNVLEAILSVYPKAKDCVHGHIGIGEKHIETEIADDRSYSLIVIRCSHCNMPINEEYEDTNDLL